MLKKTKALQIGPETFKLGDVDLSDAVTGYVIEATQHGTRLHVTSDVDLAELGVPIDEVYQAHPPPWQGQALLDLDADAWDAIVGGRPSFGEGSNPGAKIRAYIEQMEPPSDSGG